MKKKALILGGTKGLGLALAWESDKRGVYPVIAGRSAGFPASVNFPTFCEVLKIDLSNPTQIEELTRFNLGPLDYIFLVAGIFYKDGRKPFVEQPLPEFDEMIAVHLRGALRALQIFHLELRHMRHPYHLVMVSSTSSWKMRENETLYCALQAAKAVFARQFSRELVRDLPGSKLTLVNPGGMKTPDFWRGTEQDIMEPSAVAEKIWNEVVAQEEPFEIVNVTRDKDGNPVVSYGPRLPEMPF